MVSWQETLASSCGDTGIEQVPLPRGNLHLCRVHRNLFDRRATTGLESIREAGKHVWYRHVVMNAASLH